MGVKTIEDLPFKTGFSNLIGSAIPKCCAECETAKFHYGTCCSGVMIFMDCKSWNRCPLRNKTTKEVTNG